MPLNDEEIDQLRDAIEDLFYFEFVIGKLFWVFALDSYSPLIKSIKSDICLLFCLALACLLAFCCLALACFALACFALAGPLVTCHGVTFLH